MSSVYHMPTRIICGTGALMAERAVPGLYAGTAGIERFKSMKITDDTVIESVAPRKMTVSQAEAIFTACIA
ncbi:hypothetical protein ACFFWD_05855 [Bradyrhizobium erythrophlei]|uniref:hypothetical protein n=1 Tax=Bradyrhizobium erythrophlei TaxID=1437360 RepID=UPI0035E83796